MKNFSGITDNLDITTKKYVDDGLAGKANLAGNNTFTGGQTITGSNGGYSINASGYVKGSWLQAPSTGKAGSNTGKVCVLDGSGWVYYRTPSEIVSDGGGAKASDIPTDYVTTNTEQTITSKKTFNGEVKFGSTENFQGYYIKRMIGSLGAGTRYADLDSSYKDGTWHRMWRLRFPSGSSFWGKIKITLYGGYSSFNASGVMSKSITCNFNTSSIYNNVGCYDGLGVNVEQDFRISEAIWNATASAWEVLIWQKNLSGNNSPTIMLECWTTNNTNYINAFNGIAAQTVELTQSTSYSAQKASSTGGTKTVMWAALPVYENPLGEEIATMSDLSGKANLVGDNTFTGKQYFAGADDNVILDCYFGNGNNASTIFGVTHNSLADDSGHVLIGSADDNNVDLLLSNSAGTSGQVLTSQGAGKTPIWTTPSGGGDNSKHGYTELTNEDLNTILTPGWYRAARNHSCKNIPIASPNEFILIVESSSPNYIQQTFYNIGILSQYYIRYTNNGGTSWSGAGWYTYQLVGTAAQTFSGRKTFSNGINLNNSLQVGGSSGTTGQFLMSQGGSTPKWSSIQVKANGTTYTADSSGLIDLGTIGGGSTVYESIYNDIY